MKGVVRTVVGYTGGNEANPTYRTIFDATEAVLIEFDPKIISYKAILRAWAQQHNPQYKVSTQYRSALWVQSKAQREAALAQLETMRHEQHGFGKSNKPRKIYVDIEDIGRFYRAEEYHQDYLTKHTGGTGFF
mmetsp:Transcript_28337/g.46907  ORF Transcript_28337/g.46907 Transcript_28337/m.46907 type:complete len:133 (-) Transcript_28337:97-495(-)